MLIGAIVLVVMATRVYSAFRGFVAGDTRDGGTPLTGPDARGDSTRGRGVAPIQIGDSLRGRSGALRFATLTAAEASRYPGFVDAYGEPQIHRPASLPVVAGADTFSLVVMRPFAAKRGDVLNGYRLGRWPAERWLMARNYFNPDGFVEVVPENVSLPLSRHFTLGQFVTRDQQEVWPKYVVLEEKLIDKLELVLQELGARGIQVTSVVVLSGFRAPYYNERRIEEGAARASRHQFGDAADILIDNDGDGRMDDVNGDRRVDLRDMLPVTQAVATVERRYPELIGGLGTYAAMGPSGPFAHVDVRGTSARWERAQRERVGTP
jgi:uncharacterized protein YcbK (DUF882 family)